MRKTMKSKRTATSHIDNNTLQPRSRRSQTPQSDSVATNLRRSTRKRKISINLEDYETYSSDTEDDDLMALHYWSSRSKAENNASHDDVSAFTTKKRILNNQSHPRREGLRPRIISRERRAQTFRETEDANDSFEEQAGKDQTENDNDPEEGGGNEEQGGVGDEEEEGNDEDGEEEQEGRRRYDLRNRADVRRHSPEKEEKQRPRSPRRARHHGMESKANKYLQKGGSRVHKKYCTSLPYDSDDSLLVDEMDQDPAFPLTWNRSRSESPWLSGGLDMQGSTAWGLNVAASGWGHQSDGLNSLTTGIQTAGPSSKGGADIQPLQVDENVSFNDIGGLSEYIDALKEMVFFPLLYPNFFAKYHINPPRGVLLCGPPGTGKTLIARALACAASKAGQKVSFYMRKGADVLSKWVGEAERQLRLLFEEAQKNQPSIIFFDEIDGLAPVRSGKQEQIHNSIVSTLLALMDGLDSRGQVVLIGATNRIDAIDGALRRPGRFDREFVFPLPGFKARAEILAIHTRKWKAPPSPELKMELASSCVGYCGADLKSLCTEAAISAFREKYPQAYTSDEKFVIDVDSIKVEKYHFTNAMSTINPAAHRGSIVHSRPLPSIVAPCLQKHLHRIMEHISDIFPCVSTLDVRKLSAFSYGSAFPLVYRPRLLIYGDENMGLDHVGPAVLHELEKFSVHSLGLASLLSDPSVKTTEEALVHIFSEARRTTPSILYIPQFHIWWETAHEQLRAVLITLLEELPSNLPILLIGTSSVSLNEMDEGSTSIFAHNMYQMDRPSIDERSLFLDKLIEAALSLQIDESINKSGKQNLPELRKAPKEVSSPKASELKAKAEDEQNVLRRLRMCLRDVCNWILCNKRFSVFHYPVMDEDEPDYRTVIQYPMDVATMLQRVDNGHYPTLSSFSKDIDLIVANAKAYNGDDYNGGRIVSRAHELRDVVLGMLSQMDPVLVSFSDKIAEQCGPLHVNDKIDGKDIAMMPVGQQATVRSSSCLGNVQPEGNLQHSFEVPRHSKKNNEVDHPVGHTPQSVPSSGKEDIVIAEPDSTKINAFRIVTQVPVSNGSLNGPETTITDVPEALETTITDVPEALEKTCSPSAGDHTEDAMTTDVDIFGQVEKIKQRFIERTEGYGVPQLERLYSKVMRGVITAKNKLNGDDRVTILGHLLKFVEDGNFEL